MYLYVATDGRFSKIGVTRDPATRKPHPIRLDGDRAAPVRSRLWRQPDDNPQLFRMERAQENLARAG